MSTHIHTAAETESRTETRPTGERDARDESGIGDATDAPNTSDATDAADAADSVGTTHDPDTADDVRSRMDRCQRQFSSTDTRRLRNLADEANESMPNPE